MSRRSFSLIAALGLLANLAFSTPSQAASITYTSTVVPNSSLPLSVGLTLPLFNPDMGTLTAVTLSVEATILGKVQIVNISGSLGSPTNLAFTNAFTQIPVTVTGPDSLTVSATAVANVASGIATASPDLTTFSGIQGSQMGYTPVPAAEISTYVGSGTFGATLSASAGNATSGGTGGAGFLFFGGTAEAGGSADVTYTYTAIVPEPASMSLLGIGMAGFFAFRRFFNKRSAND